MATPEVNDAFPAQLRQVRGLVFDVIGTCTNWHTPVSTCLRAHPPPSIATTSSGASAGDDDWASRFAHEWRSAFFTYVADLATRDEMVPSNKVYMDTLKQVMAMKEFAIEEGDEGWNDAVMADLVKSWEAAEAWKDTAAGLRLIRRKFIVIALTNGWTNTSIKINRRNDLEWDTLLNSEVIGTYKPNPKTYQTAIRALQAEENPGELAMVAAHTYDVEAAKKHGMRTIYIRRATEDRDISDEALRGYGFDLIVAEGGLGELARRLGCDV